MMPSRLTTPYIAETSSFVSGGSRPTAPIKTAIIRPTNFYEGLRRSSFGSSPGSKLKLHPWSDQSTNHNSPFGCASEMAPLTPEADSDPLSDNSAVMYGTNATHRRKSKVEAWIESSSSARSEDSLSEDRTLSGPRRNRRAMQISASSTLSKEEVDLSFEDLCQELLALSASCSTLERMISKADVEINSNYSVTHASTDSREQGVAGRMPPDDTSRCLLKHSSARTTGSGHKTERASGGWAEQTMTVDRLGLSPFFEDFSGCQSRLGSADASTTNAGLKTRKMTALTIDVGPAPRSHGYHSLAHMPIRDSLVTVTSPQALPPTSVGREGDDTEPLLPNHRINKASRGGCVNRVLADSCQMTPVAMEGVAVHLRHNDGENFARLPSVKSAGSLGVTERARDGRIVQAGSESLRQQVARVAEDPAATDHVAAAITTQHVSAKPVKKQAPPFHRSVSEPTSFITFTPDRRASLVRSPTKKDSKSRQLLRVGMDFIRRKESPPTTADQQLANYSTKDNLLMNNLDICNQSKLSIPHSDKMALNHSTPASNPAMPSQSKLVKESIESDSVFEDNNVSNSADQRIDPVYSSTYKGSEPLPPRSTSTSDRTNRNVHESLSSSFESEAVDILASLKSASALKAQFRHGKFPTDVDPVTGSPRHPVRSVSEDRLKLLEGLTHSRPHQHSHCGSNKSSCLSSPSASGHYAAQLHPLSYRSSHSQTPSSRRSRQSYYDNVLQSPYGGLRISVASGSSSSTVFSRPWGDLHRLDDYFQHGDEFRYRVGSGVSSQGGILSPRHHHSHTHFKFPDKDDSGSPTSFSRSGSDEHQHSNLYSVPRFPVSGLPDVALEADVCTPQHQRPKNNLELALKRTRNRILSFTKLLLTTEGHSCEITRYTQTLLSDAHSLPGTLVGRFHTCTWETNSLERNQSNSNPRSNGRPTKPCCRADSTPKTDWYSNNIQSNWALDSNGKITAHPSQQAYANGGYLLSVSSKDGRAPGELVSSVGAKEHIVLSNVRQFVDGMKRYLLNQPDAQMMFAIQRERIKKTMQLGFDQFINLDAIMEAVLERVVLQPLSDHLLNVITTHTDYSIRDITQIEGGMRVILQHRAELFNNLQSALAEIDSHDKTLRQVFQTMKSEFSPISKLQHLLQISLLCVGVHNHSSSTREQDLLLLFIYTMARYGDATLIVHLAYIRHLIPLSLKSGATAYVLSLYETTVQVYSRIVRVPGPLVRRVMILHDILEKLSCHLMVADESMNRVIRKKMYVSRWSSTTELIDIIQVDLANHELAEFRLYLATDEKEVQLRPNDNINEQLMTHSRGDNVCALVYRRPNTQMLLPPP